MAVVPFEQRSYPGAAPDTSLAFGIGAADLGFSVQAGTGVGYPDGSAGPFFVIIDYNATSAEKVHCTSRTGDAFVVDVRGADGTTAQDHGPNALVQAIWTATDAQESNQTAHQTVGQISSKGDLLSGSAANTLVKTPLGTTGQVLTANSSLAGGIQWQPIPENLTLAGATISTSTIDGATLIDGTSAGTIVGNQLVDEANIAANTANIATLTARYPVLTLLAGQLAAQQSSSGVMFTVALTVGTWLVTVSCDVFSGAGASVTCSGATGITLTGATEAILNTTAGNHANTALSFQAVVATAGNLTINAALGASSVMSGGGGVFTNGYTALRVA